MALTPEQRSLRASAAAHTRWSREDPQEALEHTRQGWQKKFERQVDPDGTLPVAERQRRAQSAMKAEMKRLALASSKARAKRADK